MQIQPSPERHQIQALIKSLGLADAAIEAQQDAARVAELLADAAATLAFNATHWRLRAALEAEQAGRPALAPPVPSKKKYPGRKVTNEVLTLDVLRLRKAILMWRQANGTTLVDLAKLLGGPDAEPETYRVLFYPRRNKKRLTTKYAARLVEILGPAILAEAPRIIDLEGQPLASSPPPMLPQRVRKPRKETA